MIRLLINGIKVSPDATEDEILLALEPDYISGLTILGGEPFEPENQQVLAPFLQRVKQKFPQKTIWCYTGGILERDILSAVRYHTTGRAGMSRLEQVVFTADFTSADRDYPDVDVMRRLADRSLEEAMRYGIDYTIRDLTERGRTVHPDTIEAYHDIVLSEEKREANE